VTRERLLGFLLGMSVGTAIGFYLRPPETDGESAPDSSSDNRDYVNYRENPKKKARTRREELVRAEGRN